MTHEAQYFFNFIALLAYFSSSLHFDFVYANETHRHEMKRLLQFSNPFSAENLVQGMKNGAAVRFYPLLINAQLITSLYLSLSKSFHNQFMWH